MSAIDDFVYETFTDLLNNNCNRDELKNAIDIVLKEYNLSGDEVALNLLSKFISFHLRRGEYDAAEKCLEEHRETRIQMRDDSQIRFKVMEQYLCSVVKRCKGEYAEGYQILKESLDDLKTLPDGIIHALFHVQMATLENILAMKTNDREEMQSLIKKAEENYNTASSYLKQNPGCSITRANYLQKIYINKALLYLGCSLSGDMLGSSHEFINVDKAKHYLLKTQEIIHEGYPLCKFRMVQNLLAKACFSYRLENNDPSQQIKNAVNYSTEAADLAETCIFAEMQRYAERYKKFFKKVQAKSRRRNAIEQ